MVAHKDSLIEREVCDMETQSYQTVCTHYYVDICGVLKGLDKKNLKGHAKCKTLEITHLSFASDVLIFFKGKKIWQ